MDGTGYTLRNIKLPSSWLPAPEWDSNHKTTNKCLKQQEWYGRKRKSIGFQQLTSNPANQNTQRRHNPLNCSNSKLKFTAINYGGNTLCSSRSVHSEITLSTFTWEKITSRFHVSTMNPMNSSFEMDVQMTFSNLWWTLSMLDAMLSPSLRMSLILKVEQTNVVQVHYTL